MQELEVDSSADRLELRAIGTEPLKHGFVEPVADTRAGTIARSRCVVEGAKGNTRYEITLLVHPFDPTGSNVPVRFASASLDTNADGDCTAEIAIRAEDVPTTVRGASHGLRWVIARDGTPAFQSECTTVTLAPLISGALSPRRPGRWVGHDSTSHPLNAARQRGSRTMNKGPMKTRLMGIGLLTLVLVMSAAGVAHALTMPSGTTSTVNDGPGDQTDPHVSGDLVSYTSNADGTSRIRYHDLATAADGVVPNSGEDDFLSDISGDRIVFTRVSSSSAIYVYQVGTIAAGEVAPGAGVNRRNPSIGGGTVAWQDFGFTASALAPEIVAYDLATGTATRLTTDLLLDRNPAVSPDGGTIVWTKCDAGTSCDIWKAVLTAGTWTASAVTGAEGEESTADTNGSIVAYASTRLGDSDIFWKPVAGGTETRLAITGSQSNPNVSGSLIAFDDGASGNTNVMAFDTETNELYQVTSSPTNETLNDIWVGGDGLVRVAYQSDATGDWNVYTFSWRLPTADVVDTIPELVDLVRSFNLQQGIANSLDAKLENANKALEKAKEGDTVSACNLIDAFLNEVEAQEGNELTEQQADELRAAAALIKAELGCG